MEQTIKGPVRVQIFGQDYFIKSDEEEDYILAVARLVDERMRKVAESTSSAGTVSIAVLAALNLAADYLKAQERSQSLQERVGKRSQELITLIEES